MFHSTVATEQGLAGLALGWRVAKSYDRGKAWPSLNHSILSGLPYVACGQSLLSHLLLGSFFKTYG
jgi:hypothetical protein